MTGLKSDLFSEKINIDFFPTVTKPPLHHICDKMLKLEITITFYRQMMQSSNPLLSLPPRRDSYKVSSDVIMSWGNVYLFKTRALHSASCCTANFAIF